MNKPGSFKNPYGLMSREEIIKIAETTERKVIYCHELDGRLHVIETEFFKRQKRDRDILSLSREGKTQRQIAAAVGVSLGLVNKVMKRTKAIKKVEAMSKMISKAEYDIIVT